MIPEAVNDHLRTLSGQYKDLRIHALVDGIQYQRHTGQALAARPGAVISLFAGTDDEPMAEAGPWLVDPSKAPELAVQLMAMEPERPGITWLIVWQELDAQAAVLRSMIDATLPGGRRVMLRFWDPRALVSLYRTLGGKAWSGHFRGVLAWHFIENGKRLHIKTDA
jgi:hypothetical protein